jgi:hypothetical protein
LGDILSIRVLAQTMDEEDVARTWPALCTLVWPRWMSMLKLQSMQLMHIIGPTLGPSSVERLFGQKQHGVLELAQSLADIFRIGESPSCVLPAVKEPLAKMEVIFKQLNKALADWKTQEANLLTNELENALNAMEQAILLVAQQIKAS